MKKTILTFGPISAIVMALMYVFLCFARNSGNIAISEILTYAGVLVLFIMVFIGVKSYRDHTLGGFITFGKAFKVGILISLVSSLSSAIIWVILYKPIFKDFMVEHSAAMMDKLKTSSASVVEIAAKKEEVLKNGALYNNPLYRAGIIFIQAFPLEAIMTVIASFILRKKQASIS